MKTYLIIFSIILLSFSSCTKDPDPITVYNTIINQSSYNMRIVVNNIAGNDTILLAKNMSKAYKTSDIIGTGVIPFDGDKATVTFGVSVSIIHYRDNMQSVSRNIFSYANWPRHMNNDINYYEYIFTDDDYEEALAN